MLTELYVVIMWAGCAGLVFDTNSAQTLAQQPIDWSDAIDDLAIDGARCLVRCCEKVWIQLSSRSRVRALSNNQLTGSISSSIGQLTQLELV